MYRERLTGKRAKCRCPSDQSNYKEDKHVFSFARPFHHGWCGVEKCYVYNEAEELRLRLPQSRRAKQIEK